MLMSCLWIESPLKLADYVAHPKPHHASSCGGAVLLPLIFPFHFQSCPLPLKVFVITLFKVKHCLTSPSYSTIERNIFKNSNRRCFVVEPFFIMPISISISTRDIVLWFLKMFILGKLWYR